MQKKKIVGVLLAGGLSRRYGSPKAFATLNGKKFYEIAYDVLAPHCDDVIIVTRPELVERFSKELHVMIDHEQFSGCGPLAGIYSAIVAKEAEHYVVLPCDMPLLTEEIIGKLIKSHKTEVTVTVVESRLQPLVSIWNRSSLAKIKTTLERKQYKMTEVLKLVEVEYVDATLLTKSPHVFMNINTPEEDLEARKWDRKRL